MTRSTCLALITAAGVLAASGLGTVGVAGCGVLGGGSDSPSTCYPSPPMVTPAQATAGSTVTVTSASTQCPYRHRPKSFELRLQTEALGTDRSGVRLGRVTVDRRTLAFETEVVIPSNTSPGAYYVKLARASIDHYVRPPGCDDTASCVVLPSNLTVIP